MDRRKFLEFSISALATGSLVSCARYSLDLAERECGYFDQNKFKPLRIDMHCHLLNLQDIDEEAFLIQNVFNLDEKASKATEERAAKFLRNLGKSLSKDIWDLGQEHYELSLQLKQESIVGSVQPAWYDSQSFCYFAGSNQNGPLASANGIQLTGIFSNRLRNAARMMTIFPDVDLFTPSMIDLFEDEKDFKTEISTSSAERIARAGELDKNEIIFRKHAISTQVHFYSNLNLVTHGRFLPYVSFNPARQYFFETQQPVEHDYLYWVEKAITDFGFIGVKIHPSAGFSPIDNLRYGCHNRIRKRDIDSDKELFDRFKNYDNSLMKVFQICKKLDVPILSHGGDSISANTRCMQGAGDFDRKGLDLKYYEKRPVGAFGRRSHKEWRYGHREERDFVLRPETSWTNSVSLWLKAMSVADSERGASSNKLRVALGHFANGIVKNSDSRGYGYSPSLDDVINANNENLFVDLSLATNLYRGFGKNQRLDLFKALFAQDLAISKNILYGTDWHMPDAAIAGSRFYAGIESILPSDQKAAVMGENSVRFLGLAKNQQNRERLSEFYARKRRQYPHLSEVLDEKNIGWMKKVDRL